MGVFSGLNAEAYDRTYRDLDLIRRIAAYFGRYNKRMWSIVFYVSVISLAGAGQPLIVSWAVEALASRPSSGLIWLLFGFMTVFGVGIWAANWIRRRLTARLIGDVVSDLRDNAFAASINHDMTFFDEFASGRIISRITSDTQEFAQLVQLVTDIASQILLVVVLLGVLFYVSVPLTLLLLAFAPVIIIFTLIFRRIARFVTRKGFRVLGEVNTAIQEAVTGISIAKNFRQEETIYRSFGMVNEQSYQVNLRRGFVLANVFPILITMTSFGTAALI